MKYENGTLWLHQSDISHYIMCPEQFRISNGIGPGLQITDDRWRVESDAALIGTTMHAVIERDLKSSFTNLPEMDGFGKQMFGDAIQGFVRDDIEYRSETYGGDPGKTLGALEKLIASWWQSDERMYWQQRDPKTYIVEQYFDVHFVDRSDRTIQEIRLAGTPDIIDIQENRVVDWKSAGRKYQRWEKQRWAIQPTAYTFAAAEQGHILPDSEGMYRFDFKVFERRNRVAVCDTTTVYRSSGQWGWLAKLVSNIADMMESDASVWPLRDDHALCGPKWCPVWYDCKGAYVNEDWS